MKYLFMLLFLSSLSYAEDLTISAKSAIIVNNTNNEVLYSKNITTQNPIASITKLMTAIIVIDANQSPDELITINKKDVDTIKKTHSRLTLNTKHTRQDLLLLALMSSENRAANALVRNYPNGKQAAIEAMNRKAKLLNMLNTTFSDGTGLSSKNKSTPQDLSILTITASTYPLIHQLSTNRSQLFIIKNKKQLFKNTNPLIRNPNNPTHIEITKTGFTNEAGRCITMIVKTANNTPVTIVLMNAPSSIQRTKDVDNIILWLNNKQI